MIAVTHFFIGLLIGSSFFGRDLFTFQNFLIILIYSNGLDLDHLYKFNSRPKNHLRTFIQEPFGFLILGIPSAIILAYFLGYIYFWVVFCLYGIHIIADYCCIFETYPLDPFNREIVKKEGMGIILTFEKEWLQKRKKFPYRINEIFIIIVLICLNLVFIYFTFLNKLFLF